MRLRGGSPRTDLEGPPETAVGAGHPSGLGCRRALPGIRPSLWQALHLQSGDKNCLVARSKCYLKMGDLEKSLKDAEASLQNDPTFCKVTAGREGSVLLSTFPLEQALVTDS